MHEGRAPSKKHNKNLEIMRNLHYLTDSFLDAFEKHKAKLKNGGIEGS
ncbi:hypothetical protein [Bartonella sp. CM120XJJH]